MFGSYDCLSVFDWSLEIESEPQQPGITTTVSLYRIQRGGDLDESHE